jgi:leader peptidase (prepilin peptidase)/N-methyltransferase
VSSWLLGVAVAAPVLAAGPAAARAAPGVFAPMQPAAATPAPATAEHLRRQTLVVTLLAGIAAGAFGWRDGATIVLVPHLVLVVVAAVTSLTDLAVWRIPNVVAGPAVAATAAAWGLVAVVERDVDVLIHAAVGAVVFFLIFLVPHLAAPRSLGFGDVKHTVNLGAPLGAEDVALVPVAGFVAVALFLAAAAVTRRRRLPFGPALNVATIVVLLAQ